MRCVWWGCWAPCLLATASTSTRRGGVPLTTRKKCLPVRGRVVVGVTVGCVLGSEERFTTVSGIVFLQGEEQQLRSSRMWWLTFVTPKCEKSSSCQN